MSARLRGVAQETERIVAAGRYRAPDGREVLLAADIEAARAGTRMFGPWPVESPEFAPVADSAPTASSGPAAAFAPVAGFGQVAGSAPADTFFEVTGESSLEAARRLVGGGPEADRRPGGAAADRATGRLAGSSAVRAGGGPPAGGSAAEPADPPAGGSAARSARPSARRVAVLNFASARNPGGGFLNGAQAQEEALCRASALYTCLLQAREFYDHHRAHRDPFYTDRVIHSPAVPVFRDDRGRLLSSALLVGFLTAAAPNAGVVRRTAPERVAELPRALAVRAERVLSVAAAEGYRRLVLGAWGCGVFQNDPAQVAGAFRTLLAPGGRFAGAFEHVVFGVLDRTPGAVVRQAFVTAFAERQPVRS
ncbi:TIGR02452 family protein [Streptomyces griseorubiginosus]|uniref:TIGR02452 family protein n=1 Tax=Streptomyces griseorubiginosus TaxID=67304 RepID=UPI001140314D|nr:TIGR02452 family protein [Streptomyces griseorubiginosus]